jgi:ankyrin repeat protein
MATTNATPSLFFDAVRASDCESVRRLLADDPSLANARWFGRAGDGKTRSLGPPPFNQHTWLPIADKHDSNDPRYTSAPLIYTRDDQIVRLLVDAGADVNARGTSGDLELPDWFYTPLWRAAHDGRLASVRILAERGANLNFTNPDGSNQALKTAAENDRIETCAYLIDHGAKPDLITAAMLGLEDSVRAVLRQSPEAIRLRDEHGRSALDAATLLDNFRQCRDGLHADHDRVAALLIEHGATVELEHAASLGLFGEIERLVERDPEVLKRPKIMKALIGGTATEESPLQAARRRGRMEIVSYLLEHGAIDVRPLEVRPTLDP